MTAPVSTQEQGAAPRPLGPHPGSEPRANPSVRWKTILIGALLLALSAVLAREVWYLRQGEAYTSWVEPVLASLGTGAVTATAVTIGIVISLVGLWLIIASFMPRPHTHVRIESPASIWIRPVDIARKSTAATRAETGGENIRSKANRKSVTVQLDDDGTGMQQEQVTTALNREFRRLAAPRLCR
ncbi:hypothetical protein JKI95_05055 [Corynebacterium aquatimens]|uniref:hypothetical protein n=1 Tax=Corynebacterium aquatimens TaxID=1190508 RepID=UPI002540ED58|nr:hypothetical protein [Corynebacterium aquatimens]QYH20280.1 hypothetical protein JKI95_05055 [Corynebacterium aquatimens]